MCDFSTKSSLKMNKHKHREHPVPKPVKEVPKPKCQYCGNKFTRKYHLLIKTRYYYYLYSTVARCGYLPVVCMYQLDAGTLQSRNLLTNVAQWGGTLYYTVLYCTKLYSTLSKFGLQIFFPFLDELGHIYLFRLRKMTSGILLATNEEHFCNISLYCKSFIRQNN